VSAFDPVAAQFERFRGLPDGVAEAARAAIRAQLGGSAGARLLDLGAGTGRVGSAFAEAGDDYVGADPSRGMLLEFAARSPGRRPRLVQADGRALPFAAAAFDAVLIVQVLSGVPGWRRVLDEALRVLKPGGSLVLGRTAAPPDGLDARMRGRLAVLLEAEGLDAGRRGAGAEEVVRALSARARAHHRTTAARWEAVRTPRAFLERHRTGARFAALPAATREGLLRRLSEWAAAAFGGLETASSETFEFTLDVFRF
jgi:SAM-dependent methyltransferase